ncbi:MarR family transcriptional regulator [Planomicrobium okeanokoites]|uniref:MarR family transcriptional regulator n=1 Tax=Planomicrobium okeanokoites TaxID=244 RepID=UPI0024936DEF|nr:MarR family transcriptional regulator [Planomicrobium okeanokoites]
MVGKSAVYGNLRMEEKDLLKKLRQCFAGQDDKSIRNGEVFMIYFLNNCSSEGVLFKTIKEITTDLNMSHAALTRVLKTLEDKQFIYRRNGIIGLHQA